MDIYYIAQVWDDLVDGDNQQSAENISRAFKLSLIGLYQNPFFSRNMADLLPIMISVIHQWEDANILEKSEHDNERCMAWMLRAGIYQIFHYCAWLVGGDSWINQIGPDIRKLYGEPLEDFLKEHE